MKSNTGRSSAPSALSQRRKISLLEIVCCPCNYISQIWDRLTDSPSVESPNSKITPYNESDHVYYIGSHATEGANGSTNHASATVADEPQESSKHWALTVRHSPTRSGRSGSISGNGSSLIL